MAAATDTFLRLAGPGPASANTASRPTNAASCWPPSASASSRATTTTPHACSAISCSTAAPASRSPNSPACSASAVPPPPGSRACPPRRPSSRPTTAWMAAPTANSCRATPAPSSSSSSAHPEATRADLIDFIEHTFGVRVSRIALYKFLKKFGLDHVAATPVHAGHRPTADRRTRSRHAADAFPVVTPAAVPAPPFSSARTQYAGAFLMLGPALDWLATARDCFADDYGTLTRGLLTSVFALVVGLERIFHLDEMEDPGFALLDRRPPLPVAPQRRRLAPPPALVRGRCLLPPHQPLALDPGRQIALVSYDEHTIPRWTHKFRIPKGYVTTRNKYMRCEKLFYSYDLLSGRYLAVRATPGDWGLIDLAVPLTRQTLRTRPARLPACPVRRRGGQVRRRGAGVVGPGRASTTRVWT